MPSRHFAARYAHGEVHFCSTHWHEPRGNAALYLGEAVCYVFRAKGKSSPLPRVLFVVTMHICQYTKYLEPKNSWLLLIAKLKMLMTAMQQPCFCPCHKHWLWTRSKRAGQVLLILSRTWLCGQVWSYWKNNAWKRYLVWAAGVHATILPLQPYRSKAPPCGYIA